MFKTILLTYILFKKGVILMSYTINKQYQVTECCYQQKPNVQYVVIHYTGNSRDVAVSNARYFYNNASNVGGSAHFFVDDGFTVYSSVPECYCCWGVGVIAPYKK